MDILPEITIDTIKNALRIDGNDAAINVSLSNGKGAGK